LRALSKDAKILEEGTVMLLSEAMRLGAMIRPQVKYLIFARASDGALGSCALGAAYEAAGMAIATERFIWDYSAVSPEWLRLLGHRVSPCPVCGSHAWRRLGFSVTHLNNDHGWSRERIADWVQAIEDEVESRNHPQEDARQTSAEELSELVSA
jgi:hypothetical protein